MDYFDPYNVFLAIAYIDFFFSFLLRNNSLINTRLNSIDSLTLALFWRSAHDMTSDIFLFI